MLSDGVPTHIGWQSSLDEGHTALYRDGVLIAESDAPGHVRAELPADASRYEMATELIRGAGDVSTRISARWTFESRYVNEDQSTVPILGARFSPHLDDTNTAPANRTYTIPVTVEGASGGVTLTVQFSHDDGATWHTASVKPSSGGWNVRVLHPAGAGHISLRTQVSDQAGKTLQQTIIRAYHTG
jgi:hypothetical protein